LPEQKYISDAGKKAPELGAFSSGIRLGSDYPVVSELARSERRLDTMPPQPNLQAYERRLRQDARLAKFSSIGLSKLARFALRRSSGKPLLTLEGC
jgi:hypothetical protein